MTLTTRGRTLLLAPRYGSAALRRRRVSPPLSTQPVGLVGYEPQRNSSNVVYRVRLVQRNQEEVIQQDRLPGAPGGWVVDCGPDRDSLRIPYNSAGFPCISGTVRWTLELLGDS
ncbi:unnamed protein product [Lota lota]